MLDPADFQELVALAQELCWLQKNSEERNNPFDLSNSSVLPHCKEDLLVGKCRPNRDRRQNGQCTGALIAQSCQSCAVSSYP